jgi:hypothetical protein
LIPSTIHRVSRLSKRTGGLGRCDESGSVFFSNRDFGAVADKRLGEAAGSASSAAPQGFPNYVAPAVIETYNVTSCDMVPANGEVVFSNNSLTDVHGNPEPLDYTLSTVMGAPSGFPSCGYGGSNVGNDFKLFFGGRSGCNVGAPGHILRRETLRRRALVFVATPAPDATDQQAERDRRCV